MQETTFLQDTSVSITAKDVCVGGRQGKERQVHPVANRAGLGKHTPRAGRSGEEPRAVEQGGHLSGAGEQDDLPVKANTGPATGRA